jgi:hypothetical protein
MEEVKVWFKNRQYKNCSTRCIQILDNIKDPVSIQRLNVNNLLTYNLESNPPSLSDLDVILRCCLSREDIPLSSYQLQRQATPSSAIPFLLRESRIISANCLLLCEYSRNSPTLLFRIIQQPLTILPNLLSN